MSVLSASEAHRSPTPPSELSARPGDAIVLPVLLVAAVIVRFAFIGTQGFWFDEAHTSALVRSSLPGMLHQLPTGEDTPPLYFVAAWIWGHLFGYGEIALRSLSALAGVATVAVVYELGKQLASRRTGLIAAAITTFNPLLVWYSQEARSYSLLVLLIALGLLAFVRVREQLSSQWVLIWSIASSLALMTHYFSGLLVVPEFVVLLLGNRHDWRVRRALAPVLIVGLALLPLMIRQLANMGGKQGWIGTQPLLSRIGAVPITFVAGYAAPARPALCGLVALVALGAIAAIPFSVAVQSRRGAADMGGLMGVGVAIVAILIVLGFDELDPRNVLVLLIPLIALVAIGLASFRPRLLGLALTGIVCVTSLVAIVGVDTDAAYQRPDWRPVAEALGATAGAGTAIFILNGCQGLPLALYMPGLQFPTRPADVARLDLIRVHRPISWDSACSTYGLNRPLPRAFAGFQRIGKVRRIGRFSIEHLGVGHVVRLGYRTNPRARFLVGGLPGILLVEPGSSTSASS